MDFSLLSTNFSSSQPIFSLSQPSYSMTQPLFSLSGLSVPTQHVIDDSNFSTRFKHPSFTDQMRLSSDSASKSYNGIYHNFYLPIVGDYTQNFQLQSNYILRGFKDSMVQVDCLNNYIESVSLSVNNGTNIITRVDNFTKIESVQGQYLTTNELVGNKLDFLNMPLLTKCLDTSNYQITLKFTQSPPIKYELIYDIMFTDDKNYHNVLKEEDFIVAYQAKQSNSQRKKISINYKNGQLCVK